MPNLIKDREFIQFVKSEFGPDYGDIKDPSHLNDGYCVLVAKYLSTLYPKAETWTIGHPMSYHVVIKIGDKYYDGVDVKGVTSLKDLSWSKENPNTTLNPKRGIPYEF